MEGADSNDAPRPVPVSPDARPGHRRPPNAAEQARRVAWGKMIGAENKRRYEKAIREQA